MPGRAWPYVLLLASLLPARALGQVSFEFSFSNPGARSLGFGGAFVALADDATAAYANPAGLVQLAKPEVSIEGRSWRYSTPYSSGGRVAGQPTGIGLDTTAGLRGAESTTAPTDLSFLSFVYPLGKSSFAIYRHQYARFDSLIATQGFFLDGSTFAGTDRLLDVRNVASTDIVNYGLAAGFRVSDALSLGIGLSLLDNDIAFESELYLPDDDSLRGFFGESSYLPERQFEHESTTGDQTALNLTLGFLWRASGHWSVGGFYRLGLTGAELKLENRSGPASPSFPAVLRDSVVVSFPDVYGLGTAFHSADGRLTVSFEWDRIEYLTLFESAREQKLAIPDGDEWHWGIEYVFLGASPAVAVRLGAWLDPDHRARAVDGDPLQRAILRPGDDEIHLAAGLGLAFASTFQIDLGVDFSDPVDTVSVSMIYSF